jgi:hypothetical protein
LLMWFSMYNFSRLVLQMGWVFLHLQMLVKIEQI